MLTAKQDKFCHNIVSGMSGKDSYLNAYNTKCTDNTAYVESTKLLKRDDIQDRIKDLRKPIEIKTQTTVISERQKKRDILWSFINDETKDDSNRLRALDLLNKLDGEYVNITKDITEDKTNIEQLDNNTLLKLVN